ncbi:MAG: nucleoside triphosphate pyrophosphohydrolase [Lawsonibacter sp.]|nr:nucleoside triphosphate pyrophosphohydrolase [Lawsonibacter sp.]
MVNFQRMDRYGMDDLIRIMELLRSPEGCPWDREQTHKSIRRNMLEEAYEAAEAIDQEDPVHLKEELGDVLLQVVFHARMAQEAGQFTFDDVVDGICKKLVFRHPHVFGAVDAPDTDRALSAWEAQKREEKGQKTAADTLDAVARSLPALTRAEKIQEKARKAGFDWDAVGPVLDKISEEAAELRQAVRDNTNIEEELGDLLFVTVKAGRFLGLDSELALHAACEKFIRRFRRVEELADKPMTQLDVPALETLWRQAKAMEHQAT